MPEIDGPVHEDTPRSPTGRVPNWVLEEMAESTAEVAVSTPVEVGKAPSSGPTLRARPPRQEDPLSEEIQRRSRFRLFAISAVILVGWLVLLTVPAMLIIKLG